MALKFVSAAESDLTCPICFQYYVIPHDPKNFPACSHICCLLCLKEMTKDGSTAIECPQCKQSSILPDQGVDEFHTCLTVRNLAEKHPEGIKQRVQQMQSDLRNIQVNKSASMKEFEDMKGRIESEAKQGIADVEKAIKSMTFQAQDLIANIKSVRQSKIAELQQQILHVDGVDPVYAIQSELESIADDEFFRKADSFSSKILKLKAEQSTADTQNFSVGRFVASNQLGRLIRSRQLKLVQEVSGVQSAVSISSKPDGMLAVCDSGTNPTKVFVFEKYQGLIRQETQFGVNTALQDGPIDIAMYGDDRLVITTFGPKFNVVSVRGKQHRTIDSSKTVHESRRLRSFKDVSTFSVTKLTDDRPVVGVTVQSSSGDESSLLVYDPKMLISKIIRVTIMPIRIAGIRSSHIAVCNSTDQVCVYSLESGVETLSLVLPMPCGICYDEFTDCLLIGRGTEKDKNGKIVRGSSVIEQYCSVTGKLVSCLARRLCCPAGITITHDGLLAVADGISIKLFRMN